MPLVQKFESAKRRTRGGQPFDERQERILNAAMGCFARLGFRKTSLDDVARACGLVKTALYHYFESKEALYAAVIRREVDRIEAALERAERAEDEPIVRLQSVLILRFELARDMLFLNRIRPELMDELAESAAEVREEYFRREELRFERILRDGQKRGTFTLAHPALAARAIVAALRGVEREILAEPNSAEARKLVEQIVYVLLYGLLAPPPGMRVAAAGRARPQPRQKAAYRR